MEEALLEIIAALREGAVGGRNADAAADAVWLDKLVRRHNRAAHDGTRRVAKRRLLPFYLHVRSTEPERWAAWDVSDEVDAALVRLLQAKPRRTASGVATITVLTKPWPCSGDCVFCPSDIRMPKSYLADEPACQRAERCWFDPYLQVAARLAALTDMGHVTDKVELIVLGGTWSDYPASYQRWFIGELFCALNASDEERTRKAATRRARYETAGLPRERNEVPRAAADVQQRINSGELGYNEAWKLVYGTAPAPLEPLDPGWSGIAALHRANETAAKRVVGLVVETRPDLITPESCRDLRALGCTKVQIGIQSLRDDLLAVNGRAITGARIAQAMALLRLFGFKSHVHFMVNLLGADPAADIADYRRLVTDPAFLPDEVKLYPCCLVESARLTECFEGGQWRPYSEEELVDVLAADVLATPPWTRISRMIRDISATDILVGNKKTNLRQIVEAAVEVSGAVVAEIRSREISIAGAEVSDLVLETIPYHTANTEERFLQWVTPEGKIAGFCRLSLPEQPPHATPNERAANATPNEHATRVILSERSESEDLPAAGTPEKPEAMIREVHVYGKVAALHRTGEGTQHLGLGRKLVEEACRQAAEAGYHAANVISAVGTRVYYRNLGFQDNGLYQRRPLP
ncbi:radical SAM protein [Adlercreutzia sp. R21]|uniref:tRNA carboxymethyluridine synthase n=1 Tax=Adlercreutzia wanghongyangiae TaxID=3111451 RepID=A0ABU6III5_9ACTN|nr:radical SAM protein [Adlercreutzia sp. R21]MEC4176225.1 radical SAM protein [Adlercreutzia sp. R7]MEC4184309.1 radical SAM protein [Adlercreutzia sp. R21]